MITWYIKEKKKLAPHLNLIKQDVLEYPTRHKDKCWVLPSFNSRCHSRAEEQNCPL